MDIRSTLEKHSVLPLDRFRIVQTFEDLQLLSIRRGIVFIFATWSGPAYVAFKRFTRVTASIDTSLIELFILDIDCLTNAIINQYLKNARLTTAGCGETFWVRDGKIVASAVLISDSAETSIIQHTKELLDETFSQDQPS